MKKRFFQPIWKFEEIEKQLTSLEENGWRLDKIKCFSLEGRKATLIIHSSSAKRLHSSLFIQNPLEPK